MLWALHLIWLALVFTTSCLAFVLARAEGLQPMAWVVVALLVGPWGWWPAQGCQSASGAH